jgi:hypothetical protein
MTLLNKLFIASGVAIVTLLLTTKAAAQERPATTLRKPEMNDTIRATIYADNSFQLYLNGELVAVDSIRFIPHNVIEVDVLPAYPLTIAVLAEDNADPKTGMEYANTNIGDGGLVLKFGDGTVTDKSWRTLVVSRGPVDGDTRNPRVENTPLPDGWQRPGFDDSGWAAATEYTEEEIGPKQPYFAHDFKGAKFIWSSNVKLDNRVLFRRVIETPPDGKARTDFTNLNNVVPAGGGRRPRR